MKTEYSITNKESFLRAHELYNAKEYAQALAIYQSLDNKTAAIFYNMGNCAYKLGQYTDARIYWKRAARNASPTQRADIAHNIQALDQKIGIEHPESNGLLCRGLLYTHSVSLLFLQLLFLFCWFAFFIFMRRVKKYFLLFLFIIINSILGAIILYRYAHACSSVGIVTASQITVHAGPDSSYHTVGTMSAPAECVIKQAQGDWYKVKSGILVGWIKKDVCELV